MTTSTGFGPLAGVRVLDLSHVLNGPFATMLLAHLGAEVIKVEQQDAPDRFRHAWMPVDSDHDGYEFLAVNANKKAVTLNLKHPKGREIFTDLVRTSDVVVENFSTGVMERLGFGYEALKELKSDIIYGSSKGYGETGPYSSYRSYATVAMATSGWADASWRMSGASGTQVLGPGDEAAGVSLAVGILGALYRKAVTGEGQKIEVSMQESMMGFNVASFHEFFEGQGPAGAYMEAKDGHVAFHVPDMTQEQFTAFATALGHADALEDVRFATTESRRSNLKLVQATAGEWLTEFTPKELFELLTPQKLPIGPVNTIADLMEDRHLAEREAFVKVDHPEAGEVTLLAPWIRFSETPTRITHAGPRVGEHTDEVFGELLGLSREQIDGLRAEGAV
ncbi:CaiB/BaiF CoA-transferase family protein [Leifsonia kafniensis]|uniref:CaiB/BaiF CoA-transferase family protein n=1 Tax=Leifsonia kafniensis TaxID=475957 RepID=A0ABP7KZ32_9MICO